MGRLRSTSMDHNLPTSPGWSFETYAMQRMLAGNTECYCFAPSVSYHTRTSWHAVLPPETWTVHGVEPPCVGWA